MNRRRAFYSRFAGVGGRSRNRNGSDMMEEVWLREDSVNFCHVSECDVVTTEYRKVEKRESG
jgi:hypothetical protein